MEYRSRTSEIEKLIIDYSLILFEIFILKTNNQPMTAVSKTTPDVDKSPGEIRVPAVD
jgi:hypothetical protein